MPVIRTSIRSLKRGNRPEWSGVTAAGIFRVLTTNGRFDCHEYWLVFRGKAKTQLGLDDNQLYTSALQALAEHKHEGRRT